MNPGDKVGSRTLIKRNGKNKWGDTLWKTRCDCGHIDDFVAQGNLKRGVSDVCRECAKRKIGASNATHGASRKNHPHHREWKIWKKLRGRISTTTDHAYSHYGGRGLDIDPRWKESFEFFISDMGPCPAALTIERLNNNRGYWPDNCEWKTRKAQANNRRTNCIVEFRGEKKTLTQWCDQFGRNMGTVWKRLFRLGWSVERALLSPTGKYSVDKPAAES